MRTEMAQSARADFKLILSSVITAVILFASHPHPILGIDAIKRVEPYFNSKMLVSVVPAYNGQIIVSKEKSYPAQNVVELLISVSHAKHMRY